jgi:hypothetical protein
VAQLPWHPTRGSEEAALVCENEQRNDPEKRVGGCSWRLIWGSNDEAIEITEQGNILYESRILSELNERSHIMTKRGPLRKSGASAVTQFGKKPPKAGPDDVFGRGPPDCLL